MTRPRDAEPAVRPIQLDVALTADVVVAARLRGSTALVVDVLRASTTIITALANGASAIVPVGTPDEARARAATIDNALVAGERGGERIPGFDLGNSPVEVEAGRVRGRTIVLTTSNGTRALLASRQAAAIGIAGLANLSAAVEWAEHQHRDVTVVCAGSMGAVSLEDQVCAGLLLDRLAARVMSPRLSETATATVALARGYDKDVARLATDSRWAQKLARAGYAADVAACLTVDTTALVPVYLPSIDKVVLWPG